MMTRAETNRELRKSTHARLVAQLQASRVSRNPSGNYKQERMDAVSGQEDGNRGAGNTLARGLKQKQEREQPCKEIQNASHSNVKALAYTTWQFSPVCQQLLWLALVLNGTDSNQLPSPSRGCNYEGKTVKVFTASCRSLRKQGGNGATPKLGELQGRSKVSQRDDRK